MIRLPLSARDVCFPSAESKAWIIDASGRLYMVNQEGDYECWSLPPGLHAKELSSQADGTLWLLAVSREGSIVLLRQRSNGPYDPIVVAEAFDRIAASDDGTVWAITTAGEVLSLRPGEPTRWHSPRGAVFATEISTGPDRSVWVVSNMTRYGGRVVRRRDPLTARWIDLPAPAAATKITIASDGMAWTVNAKGAVWRLHPSGGGNLAECQVDTACTECRFSRPTDFVREISVSRAGTVWVLAASDSTDALTLRWLVDPLARRYQAVRLPFRPVRVAAASAR